MLESLKDALEVAADCISGNQHECSTEKFKEVIESSTSHIKSTEKILGKFTEGVLKRRNDVGVLQR